MKSNGGGNYEDILVYRYNVYDILRRIFLWELPLGLFSELIDMAKAEQNQENLGSYVKAESWDYFKAISPKDVPELYHEIAIEYTRLIVGPYHLPTPPFESVYRNPSHLVMQQETMDVRAFYQENSFKVIEGNHVPDDHIGIELEFMCVMSKNALDAFQEENTGKLENYLAVQQEFCDSHLLMWLPKFCSDIKKNTNNDFWKNVAVLTQEFIQGETSVLKDLQMHV